MSAPPMTVTSLKLPVHLEPKCQALLEDIQRAYTVSKALFAEQRAGACAESLGMTKAITAEEIEQLIALYQQALTQRVAEWDQ